MLLFMNVVEIFSSIDGEGSRQGLLCTFLRLYDCNIRCSYCDTTYSYGDDVTFTTKTVQEVGDELLALTNRRITITGGEPLLQEEEVVELIDYLTTIDENFEFNIETNGTIVPSFQRDNIFFTFDYKGPSSLVEESMDLNVLYECRERDIMKFVVGSVQDLDRMRAVISEFPVRAQIYISPVWGQINPKVIVDYMKDYNLQDVRLQLQIHKFIWNPNEKGV
mgnify:CR=1 FL=1